MNASLRLSDEAVTGHVFPGTARVHPLTGEALTPIGFVSGRAVWPVMGGSGEGDDDTDDNDDDNDDDTGGDDDGDDDDDDSKDDDKDDPEGSKSGDKGKDADDSAQRKIADLEEEKNRHVRRRKEAERERDDFKTRLEALENKDTPEADLLVKENVTLKESNEQLTAGLTEARLQVAFLQDNTYTWHNPGRALQLADLSDVEIEKDGKVSGLKAALDTLAKEEPYLLKDNKKQEPEGKGKSGDAPNNPKKKGASKQAASKALLDKYPGLRR